MAHGHQLVGPRLRRIGLRIIEASFPYQAPDGRRNFDRSQLTNASRPASPAALTLIEEGADHICLEPGALLEPAPGKLPVTTSNDASPLEVIQPPIFVGVRGCRITGGFDPRDDAITVGHQNGLAAANQSQVMAQPNLEVGNLDDRHGLNLDL